MVTCGYTTIHYTTYTTCYCMCMASGGREGEIRPRGSAGVYPLLEHREGGGGGGAPGCVPKMTVCDCIGL